MLFLLVVYAIGLSTFCISNLMDPEQRKEIPGYLGWYFALVLPVISILGGFLHFFEPSVSPWIYYGFLVLWLTSIVSIFEEFTTIGKVEGGFSVSNILIGTTTLAILFGPGLLLGLIWLRMTPH